MALIEEIREGRKYYNKDIFFENLFFAFISSNDVASDFINTGDYLKSEDLVVKTHVVSFSYFCIALPGIMLLLQIITQKIEFAKKKVIMNIPYISSVISVILDSISFIIIFAMMVGLSQLPLIMNLKNYEKISLDKLPLLARPDAHFPLACIVSTLFIFFNILNIFPWAKNAKSLYEAGFIGRSI